MNKRIVSFAFGTVFSVLLMLGGIPAFADDYYYDETGVDYPVPQIPDVAEATPAVAKARSVARTAALAAGATETQAELAAFAVPEDLEDRKSPHQMALEEHAGEDPADVEEWDPAAPAKSSLLPTRLPKGAAPKAIAAGKRVLGWHPYWATSTDIQNYQYTNLTTIAYFSYEVNPANGGYNSIHSWNTTPVVEWAHSNNVKVVLTATLFGSTDNQRLLTNSTARNNLVNNLLTVVTNRGGDGVCIDFEGVGSWSGATAALTAFMTNLTARFHAVNPNYEVSIALPSVDWYADFAVSNYAGLDYAIIMGYDYYYSGSATPGPNAPLYSSAQWIGASSWCSVNYSMNYYLGKGISTNKLMLGVPYYGRRWAAASTNLGAASLGSAYSAALTYGACETAAASYGKKWDDNASVPYYVYTLNTTNYQCFYDDTTSLGLKYDLSNTKGMGGIGIWNLSQGAAETELWSLINDKFGTDAADPGETGGGDTGGSSATSPWTNRTSAHTANFYGVASRSGLHVASGAGGALYTSTNGINWTARSSGKSGLLMNVNGNGPLWVVVGEGGAIVTSTNGETWISRTSPTNALFRGVAYGNGIYVACGDGGAVVRSTDGITWTRVSSGTSLSLQGVGFGVDYVNMGDTNGVPAESPQFVIVGASGLIMTSTNGVSWTTRTSGTTVYISDVMYGNGYFVAVGNTRILRSADAVSWTFATNNTYLYRAAYCSGVFKTTGANGAIWTSSDGVNWEAETSGTTNTLRGISYANDQFVAAGFSGTILTKGTMAGMEEEGGGEEGGGEGETGGGDEPLGTPDETGLPQVAASQPSGPLSGVVVYTSAGHGFGANADLTAWIPERPLLYAVNEEMGNIDQLNRFAEAAWKAGATVVPFRPVGYQTNEVVLDNMDTNATSRGRVTFGGTWYNSSQPIFYGNAGDAVPYRYAAISTNASTSWASYRPNLPVAGEYPVYTWVRHGSDRVNQLYRIYHSGGVTDIRVDHRQVGCGWVWLGNYNFAAGTNGCVNIGNYTPDGPAANYIFADAIRFGNGMGTTSRGTAGLSGFESELESSRFWTIKSMGQGMSTLLYDLAGYDDRSDNIGQPARMADNMCRTNDAPRWKRFYVGFHSNAGTGDGRGAIGLYDTRIQSSYPSLYQAQTNLAAALARQCNEDMRAGTNSVIPSWSTRTSYLYGSSYGEIYNSSVFMKMDTTINEVAFHDNEADCTVLKTPAGREWLGRATVRGLIKHLSGYYPASGIVNTNAPDRPVNLKAVNSGSGAVTVSWAMPARTAASGGHPKGCTLYTSTDGRGFGNPISVSGTTATNKVITNLNAGATIFVRVCATNAGGESFNSAVAGVRVTAGGNRAGALIVDGFKRNDYGLAPTRYFANSLNGLVTLVRPRMINSFDYVKEHGLALASAGQTFDYIDSSLATSSSVLTNYSKVVWILGEESTVDETFSSTEQTAVTGYLNAGGRLMVSGAEIGWDLGRAGVSSAADLTFFTNVLRAVYSSDSGGTSNVTGKTAGFLNSVSVQFNHTNLMTDVYAANWPDVLKTGSGAVTAAVYGASESGASGAAIQYSNSTYRTIVMGFPFETIINSATRDAVMSRAMQFLGDPVAGGAVKVTLSPAAVTNTARWYINGTTNTSGSVRTGLNAGTYQVTFGSAAGYIAPAATSVVVSAGVTNVLTATYTESSGALNVTLVPESAVGEGRWSADSGSTWRTSGSTLSSLTSGTYTVSFKEIDSHTSPTSQNVSVSAGATTMATGTYVALVGDLTVNLSPAPAVSGGAQWSVNDGATWYNSGATASNLLAGRQYYTFKAVTGYSVPSTAYTTIIAGSNIVRSYSYTALPGSISMTLTPTGAVATGAAWSLDGGTNWNESGANVVDLAVKSYTIIFSSVDGYTAPDGTNYALAAGEAASLTAMYDEVEPVGADCIKSQGFDDLDVNPWSWSVAYLNNSAALTNIDLGSGVTTSPAKVLSGVNALRLHGSTNGAVNPALVLGNVNISGYTNVTLRVPFAAAGPDSGDDLHVSVSYDGGATWSPSAFGTQIADGYSGLNLDYDVLSDTNRQPQGTPYVLAVADIRTQLMVRVAFFNAAGSPNAGDYYYLDEIQLKGQVGSAPQPSSALKVTILPAGAVSSGAQWRVDGGAWRTSGIVLTGLVESIHTASFSTVSGWITPSDLVTQTTNGVTNAVSATYTEQSSGTVTIFEDDFEDGDLAGWTQDITGNWTNSASEPITGNRSLKHNLSGVAATNYIYAAPTYSLSSDKTTWRFRLKNGNWDPSGDNRYHVYLAASDSDLKGTAVNGYAVGINFTGTDDLVKLWRITGGAAAATVLTSSVDWNASMTCAIEVTRTAQGLWELKTSTNGNFSGMDSAGTASDTTHSGTSYFGLYYKCTSTRAGQVWLDDVLIYQGEISADSDSDGDGIPDWWELENFKSITGAVASADSDGDTASNYHEWIALTQPTNIHSVFWLETEAVRSGGTNVISWPSASGRTYSLDWKVNLTSMFGTAASGMAATPPLNVYTDAAHKAEGRIYYRVKVTK